MHHPTPLEPPAYRRFLSACLQANGLLLQLIPPGNRTHTLCLQAVRQNGQALAHVPFPLRDYRLCLEAVRSGADDVLPWVPTPHRTTTLCRLAVERHGGALRHVPFPLRNKALCMTALRTGRDALRDVPHRFRDLELCLAAQLRFITLSDIPPEIRECPDFHLAILKHRPSALEELPPASLTGADLLAHVQHFPRRIDQAIARLTDINDADVSAHDLALAAVSSDISALEKVPEAWRSPALYEAAVRQNPEALAYVPPAQRDEPLCRLAITQFGPAILQTPPESWSKDLCRLAVEHGWGLWPGDALFFGAGPYDLELYVEDLLDACLDEAICLQAMRQGEEAERLSFVPPRLRTRNVCLEAVTRDAYSLWFVPEDVLDRDLCLAAMRHDGGALDRVPVHWRDRELCEIALGNTRMDLSNQIPADILSQLPAAKRPVSLSRIPPRQRTARRCEAALRQDERAWESIPPALRNRRMSLLATRLHGRLDLVPESQRDWALVTAAIRRDAGQALPYVPTDLFNPGFDPAMLQGEAGVRLDAAPDCQRPYGLYRTQLAAALDVQALPFCEGPVYGKPFTDDKEQAI